MTDLVMLDFSVKLYNITVIQDTAAGGGARGINIYTDASLFLLVVADETTLRLLRPPRRYDRKNLTRYPR